MKRQQDEDRRKTNHDHDPGDAVVLRRTEEDHKDFWRTLLHFYDSGLYCDMALVCRDMTSIHCHRLVLAAFSAVLGKILADSSDSDTIYLLDYSRDQVQHFLDGIYATVNRCDGNSDDEKSGMLNNPLLQDFGFWSHEGETCRGEVSPGLLEPKVEEESESEVDKHFGGESYAPLEELGDFSDDERPLGQVKRKRRTTTTRRSTAAAAHAKARHKVEVKAETGDVDNSDNDSPEDEPRAKKKRVRNKEWRPPPIVTRFDDRDEDPKKQELYASMTSSFTTIRARVLAEPLDVSVHCNKRSREDSFFQALVGFAQASEVPAKFEAKPLAWSFPDASDIPLQFDNAFNAFRALFGFSDGDMCYNSLLYSRQGLYQKNKNHKVRYDLKRKYAKLFDEQLAALKNSVNVVNASRRYPMRKAFTLDKASLWEMTINPDMPFSELEGVALLVWDVGSGEVSGRVIRVDEADIEQGCKDCLKALFDVWCIGRPPRIPHSEYLLNKHDELIVPMETLRIITEFETEDADGKIREAMLKKERQCPDCGKIFPCVTVQDEFSFTSHRKLHFYEKYNCDCGITFDSFLQKKNHVKLVHSGGKFAKCDRCSFVGTPKAVSNHNEKEHKKTGSPCICETCGKVLNDAKALYMHMLIHKEYVCKICSVSVVGYSAYCTHRKKHHPKEPESHPCEACGKEFPDRVKLKTHFIRMHMEDKDRPYQCKDCNRGFAVSRALSAHRMMAHIKSRPYHCRYGCGVAYNDHSSRGTHEKKKHGARFTPDMAKPKPFDV